MSKDELITKDDLDRVKQQIIQEISKLVTDSKQIPPIANAKRLRTRDVRKMLGVSENKLKDMRLKKQIPFERLGNTLFYSEAEILAILNNNSFPANH